MPPQSTFRPLDWLLMILVMVAAGGARTWYLCEFAECGDASETAIRQVQMDSAGIDGVPDASTGYTQGRDFVEHFIAEHHPDVVTPQAGIRWLHVILGSLTAGLYYALSKRAFTSSLVALLAGLFCAVDPFAVVNTAELKDGVLASFLVAFVLAVGARAGQRGGALTSFLFGIALAAVVFVRLALLPFVLVTMLWFLYRSRGIKFGWLYGLLAFLGLGGGLATWVVQNHQQHQDPFPIVDSTWWHLWVGNNPDATGGPLNSDARAALGEERFQKITKEERHARSAELAEEVLGEVQAHPFRTVERRLYSMFHFFAGKGDGTRTDMFRGPAPDDGRTPWLSSTLYATLFGLLFLAFLGWRWSYAWRLTSMPLALAVIWIPIPYILGHAEWLHGPRLVLDGPMFCLAALSIGCMLPGLGSRLRAGKPPEETPAAPPTPPPVRM